MKVLIQDLMVPDNCFQYNHSCLDTTLICVMAKLFAVSELEIMIILF